jgi:hypothetical protein
MGVNSTKDNVNLVLKAFQDAMDNIKLLGLGNYFISVIFQLKHYIFNMLLCLWNWKKFMANFRGVINSANFRGVINW